MTTAFFIRLANVSTLCLSMALGCFSANAIARTASLQAALVGAAITEFTAAAEAGPNGAAKLTQQSGESATDPVQNASSFIPAAPLWFVRDALARRGFTLTDTADGFGLEVPASFSVAALERLAQVLPRHYLIDVSFPPNEGGSKAFRGELGALGSSPSLATRTHRGMGRTVGIQRLYYYSVLPFAGSQWVSAQLLPAQTVPFARIVIRPRALVPEATARRGPFGPQALRRQSENSQSTRIVAVAPVASSGALLAKGPSQTRLSTRAVASVAAWTPVLRPAPKPISPTVGAGADLHGPALGWPEVQPLRISPDAHDKWRRVGLLQSVAKLSGVVPPRPLTESPAVPAGWTGELGSDVGSRAIAGELPQLLNYAASWIPSAAPSPRVRSEGFVPQRDHAEVASLSIGWTWSDSRGAFGFTSQALGATGGLGVMGVGLVALFGSIRRRASRSEAEHSKVHTAVGRAFDQLLAARAARGQAIGHLEPIRKALDRGS